MTVISLVPPIYTNVQQYGADATGANDATTAIQAAISAAANAGGGIVYFPPGTYSVSSPLTVSTANVRLVGSGNASLIRPSASFSGAQIILLSANSTGVTDLRIAFANTNYASNPSANGIQITGAQNVLVQNVNFFYINGWIIQSSATSSVRNKWTKFDNVFSTLCLQGIHVVGVATNTNAAHVLTNCILDQVVLGDGYYLEDTIDMELSNLECNVSNGSGAALHIKGASSSIHLNNFVGGSDTPTSTGPAVLIESGPNGTPSTIELTNAIFETGSIGINIANGSIIEITDCHLNNNASHGISLGSGTDSIHIKGCTFNNNGATAGAANYDINNASTGNIMITGCSFLTVTGSAANQVAAGINNAASNHTAVTNCIFPNWPPFPTSGMPRYTRTNLGFNPRGPLAAPTIPTSTTAYTNAFAADCMVCVSGGTVSAIAIGGTATGMTSGVFTVASMQTITLTYSVAPSWTWFGN